MMKRLFAVLMVLLLLCSCASRGTVEETPPQNENLPQSAPESSSDLPEESEPENEENTPPAVGEAVPDTSPGPEEEELNVDVGDPSFATEEIPDGYSKVDFGVFSVLVSDDSFSGCAPMETVTMENDQFIGDDGENKRIIAELLSVEDVVDSDDPFAPYDEKYSDSVNTVELTFNGFAAKKYHIQTQSEGPVPVKINELFYCIHLNDEMITFAYYPVMGQGGMHTEDIEAVLDTIK